MSTTTEHGAGLHFLSMYYEAFLSGVLSSFGSTFGKLSGKGDSYVLMGLSLAAMVLVNTWSSRHYLRSLDASTNSVAPTVITAGTSYVFTGFIGLLLFDEGASGNWWIGALLIMTGLAFLKPSHTKTKEKDKQSVD